MYIHVLYLSCVAILSGFVYHNLDERTNIATELEFFKSIAIQQQVDNDECRQGLAWWTHRTQVVAKQRDSAWQALTIQWLPQIKIIKVK
jgi:hypothetical protein